jgi:anti-sigma B factor antagonist
MIEINIEILQPRSGTGTASASQVTVVRLVGEIDAVSAAVVQQKVIPMSVPGCKIILDLAKVAYMSSAGLRMLLSVYRQISGNQGRIVLVGLSDELKDTMAMTGFLGYFTVQDTLETGLQVFS